MLNVSLRQLDVFVQIALHGSVRAAAEQLHLTQPAASMALAEMERQLDAPVFDRERGRLRLNARGRERSRVFKKKYPKLFRAVKYAGMLIFIWLVFLAPWPFVR